MSAEKIEREDPSAVEWFCISCWEWMRSKSSVVKVQCAQKVDHPE